MKPAIAAVQRRRGSPRVWSRRLIVALVGVAAVVRGDRAGRATPGVPRSGGLTTAAPPPDRSCRSRGRAGADRTRRRRRPRARRGARPGRRRTPTSATFTGAVVRRGDRRPCCGAATRPRRCSRRRPTKMLTAAAALLALPADHRVATTVVARRGAGEIVLVGGGDPDAHRAAGRHRAVSTRRARASTIWPTRSGPQRRRCDSDPRRHQRLHRARRMAPGWYPGRHRRRVHRADRTGDARRRPARPSRGRFAAHRDPRARRRARAGRRSSASTPPSVRRGAAAARRGDRWRGAIGAAARPAAGT